REHDEKRRGVLLRMAEAEERHAQRWEKKLRDLGEEPPLLNDTIGRRLSRWWNKIAGAEIAIRRMEATEERQEAEFHDQAERAFAGEQDVQEFLRQRVKRKSMKLRFRASGQRSKKIRRKKSKRCRSSISYKDSRPKNHKRWQNVSPSSPNSLCRRWRRASSVCPSIGFRINGPLQP